MIKVKQDNQYVSYVLEDNTRFFAAGFRVLKKQKEKGFIPCFKTNYNGKIQLLYPVEDGVSVFSLAEEWDMEAVLRWMLHILKTLIEVRDSGFLHIDDVDMDLSRIFVDEEKESVRIIVLPLTAETAVSATEENKVEDMLIAMIELSKVRKNVMTQELKSLIRKNKSSIDLLYKKIKQVASDMDIITNTMNLKSKETEDETTEEEKGVLHLTCNHLSEKLDIVVEKDVFILGKNPKLSDFALNISPTISRQHCRITRENNNYYIEDLDSLNHTYVNGDILEKGKKIYIQKGMRIRLAEVEFLVEFRS